MKNEQHLPLDFDELVSYTNNMIFTSNCQKENNKFMIKILNGYYLSLASYACFAFLIMPT